ncbi:MAG TPA: hypothetical protein VFH31_02755 [Pyrinomonadaceae bacterium]|nr:hypothetical protein [Pyrinomonadaceae bacterium]
MGKANDGQGKELKVSSSTINGKTDRAAGVSLSVSSSTITGGNFANVDFSSIVSDALAASAAALALPGISDTVNLNSTTKTFTGSGGANVINVRGNFILNSGAKLQLNGGVDDFFIFNIAMEREFKITGSDIVLLGDLDPSRVVFNVLGLVPQSGPDDAIIQESLFLRHAPGSGPACSHQRQRIRAG